MESIYYLGWNLVENNRGKLDMKTLFVIGNGPSLNNIDMTKLKDKDTMSFNRAYIAYEDWGFIPTYFMAIDVRVINDNKDDINNLIERIKIMTFFIPTQSREYIHNRKNVIFLEFSTKPNRFFSTTWNSLCYAGDVGACSLQISYLLGYKKVVLLGCDCNYKTNIEGTKKVGGEWKASMDNDVNHFRKDYYGAGKVYSNPANHIFSWIGLIKDCEGQKLDIKIVCTNESSELVKQVPVTYQKFDDIIGEIEDENT